MTARACLSLALLCVSLTACTAPWSSGPGGGETNAAALPSAEDHVTLTRLTAKADASFNREPLADVFTYFAQVGHVVFEIRWTELKELGITAGQPVTIDTRDKQLNAGIEVALQQAFYDAQRAKGLSDRQIATAANRPTWQVQQGVVIITTTTAAAQPR